MHNKKIKILISASGTGGHLLPAQQLAKALENKDLKVLFAGYELSKKQTFDKKSFEYRDIQSSKINKKSIFLGIFKIFYGLLQSLKLIIKYKPEVIIGFGSYHTFPVILASFLLRKKIVLFESNKKLGLVNKIFEKKAKKVALIFPMEKRLQNHILVKRLPWNTTNIEKDDLKKFRKDVFTILIFGGSQGSKIINENFLAVSKKLLPKHKIQVMHILGQDQKIEFFKSVYDSLGIVNYVSNTEQNLISFYNLADLVIARAGACSISEMIYFEKPAILIPFKQAKDNHQEQNAIFMQDIVKSSEVILEDNLCEETLVVHILNFLENNKKKIYDFQKNIQSFKSLDVEKQRKDIAQLICEVANS